jgi:SAM-dependent methyltransferase
MVDVDPFDEWIAQRYETLWPELYEPGLIAATADFLAGRANGGPALELGIGTGRIAVPLSRRGIAVSGIERSAAMAARVPAELPVTVGDFARVRAGDGFRLVYLIRNTITNLTTQDEQVDAFRNAAAHLAPGGCFVVENYVPALRRLPPGEDVHVFIATDDHLGFERYDHTEQIAVSHHLWTIDGDVRRFETPHRYVWPAELDLMARIAGLTLRERWADWAGRPFTQESPSHISVWEKR